MQEDTLVVTRIFRQDIALEKLTEPEYRRNNLGLSFNDPPPPHIEQL